MVFFTNTQFCSRIVLAIPEHSPYREFGRELGLLVGAVETDRYRGKVPGTVVLPRFEAPCECPNQDSPTVAP